MHHRADWNKMYSSLGEMQKDLEESKIQGPGWWISKEDVLLVERIENGNEFYWYLSCYSEDPRKEIARVLNLPAFAL